jgi:inosine/xanthosine triphosphate pyrophosphatase family protein
VAVRALTTTKWNDHENWVSSVFTIEGPNRLAFVTGNAKKLEEVKEILFEGNSLSMQFKSRAIDCTPKVESRLTPSVDEVQGTTQEVAIHKCRQAAEIVSPGTYPLTQVGGPVITEDTALGFLALGGLPGPYMSVPLPLKLTPENGFSPKSVT